MWESNAVGTPAFPVGWTTMKSTPAIHRLIIKTSGVPLSSIVVEVARGFHVGLLVLIVAV